MKVDDPVSWHECSWLCQGRVHAVQTVVSPSAEAILSPDELTEEMRKTTEDYPCVGDDKFKYISHRKVNEGEKEIVKFLESRFQTNFNSWSAYLIFMERIEE